MNLYFFPKSTTSEILLSVALSISMFGNVHGQEQNMAFAGASSLQSLTSGWAAAWGNPNVAVTSDAQGSAFGIARACGTLQSNSATDIAGMSRLPFPSEAGSENNDFNYKCERSARSLMGIEVAVEGVKLAVSGGSSGNSVGVDCLQTIEALTLPQLRWIFSSFSDDELIEDGWDSKSVPFLDNDPSTRLWSELDPSCAAVEIVIGGLPIDSPSTQLFKEMILGRKKAETFDVSRPGSFFDSNDNEVNAEHLSKNASISYFDIGAILETNSDIALVDLKVDGEFFKTTAKALQDGTYPLSRKLYYFLYNKEKSLANTLPFVDFIFSDEGDSVTKQLGYWPISAARKLLMQTRIQSEHGVPKGLIQSYCGPPGETINIAGSSTVFPLADFLTQIYSTFCDVEITVEAGGSSSGAGRVCGDSSRGTPVQIGDMSRDWKESEAMAQGDGVFNCLKGDTTRSAIQLEVAIDGLTVVVGHDGIAKDCVEILGGLTLDQLRWMFSNYDESQLEATGWDPASVPNSDGNDQTHKWSELHKACSSSEIRISGPGDGHGTFDYLHDAILPDHENGETFDSNRGEFSYLSSDQDPILVQYTFTNPGAISFFDYNYYFETQELLYAVPIQNANGYYLQPNPNTIAGGSYNPLTRPMYMNLHNSDEDLANTVPLLTFCLENPQIAAAAGYVSPPRSEVASMIAARLDPALSTTAQSDGLSGGAIAGIVVGALVGVGIVVFLMRSVHNKGDQSEALPESAPY